MSVNPSAAIVRPSVVFGPEDNFLNRFAMLARYFPLIPIVGAATKFQPVYVGDVANAVALIIAGKANSGAIYELGGPTILDLRSIVNFVMQATDHHRLVVELGFTSGKCMALATQIMRTMSFGLFPEYLSMTWDQIELLKNNNVVSNEAVVEDRTLAGLGITPHALEVMAPGYLYRFRTTGQYHSQRLES